MRFLIASTVDPKASPPKEEPPFDEKLFAEYMRFNEDMMKAGVLVASEGLNPGSKAAQVGVVGGKRQVLDGPFAESKELVGGFYLIDVPSLEEAIKWAMRCPVGMAAADLLTVHPLTSESDIPPHIVEIAKRVAPTWTASFSKKS